MREYGRAHSKLADNLETARDNELVFINGDLVIKKDNGKHVSLYTKFVNECIDAEIISTKPSIYGFTINFNEVDPDEAVTYIENNSSFIPFSNKTNAKDTDWTDKIVRHIFGIRPCLFKDGKVVCYLDPDNYNKDIYGNNVQQIKSADVMIEFGKMYYKFISSPDSLTFKVANYKVDDTYKCIMKEKDKYMYISAYSTLVTNGIPISRPGYILDSNTNNVVDKSKLPPGYSLLSYDKYMYIVALSWLFTKSYNPLGIIGKGVSRLTGTLDNKGLFYFANTGNKFLGLENFWQYYTYLDGIAVTKNNIYSVNKEGIKSLLIKNAIQNGWVKGIEYRNGILFPSDYNASSSTHACSYITNAEDEDSMEFSNILFGGVYKDAAHCGVFSLYLKQPDYTAYRLCYN